MKHFKVNSLKPAGTVSWPMIFGTAILWLAVSSFSLVLAAGFTPPEECRDYTGDEHLNCLYTHIYLQETGKSESEIRDQQISTPLSSPTGQIDPQSSVDNASTTLAESMAVPQQPSESTAPSFRAPDECRAYTGNAHLNCLYAYIELQRGRVGKVEEDLRAQKDALSQLHDQVNRQAAANRDVEQRLSERQASASIAPPVYVAPPFYPGYGYPGYYYPRYYYPSPGVSLYLGLPGFYFGRPYYGPRFFGHHRR